MPQFSSRHILATILPTIIAVLSVYWFRKKRKLKCSTEECATLHKPFNESSQKERSIFDASSLPEESEEGKVEGINKTSLNSFINHDCVSLNSQGSLGVIQEDLLPCDADQVTATSVQENSVSMTPCNSAEYKCNGFLGIKEYPESNSNHISESHTENNANVEDGHSQKCDDSLSKQFIDPFSESPLTVVYDSDTVVIVNPSGISVCESQTNNAQTLGSGQQRLEDTISTTGELLSLDNRDDSLSRTVDDFEHVTPKDSHLVGSVQSTSSSVSNPLDCDIFSSVGTSSVSLNEFTPTSPLNSPHEQSTILDTTLGDEEEFSIDSGKGSTRGSTSRSSGNHDLENHSGIKQLVDTLLQTPEGNVFLDQTEESNKSGHESNESARGSSDCAPNPSPLCHFNNSHNEMHTFIKNGSHIIESKNYENPSHCMYDFDLPYELCGRLIGRGGKNVKFLKELTNASLCIKRHPYNDNLKLVTIEGTRLEVKSALDHIRKRYPLAQFPGVTLLQTNLNAPVDALSVPEPLQLHLPDGVSVDVILSSMVTAGHFFLQQPTHPTCPSLATLDQCMMTCYSRAETPPLPTPIDAGVICAANIMGGWYRAQVMFVSENGEQCELKYVDYGGYSQVSSSSLRQIRSDFMTLPFQASECFLANVQPLDETGFSPEASAVFEELAQGQILQALVVDYHDDGTPYVQLQRVQGITTTFINQELVRRGLATWVEHRSNA